MPHGRRHSRDAMRRFAATLVLIAGCTPQLPTRSAADVDSSIVPLVVQRWTDSGRPLSDRCRRYLEGLRVAVVDDDRFVVACGRCAVGAPADECSTERYAPAWGCLVTPGGRPTAVVSDRRPPDHQIAIAAHEGWHALQRCMGLAQTEDPEAK